MKNGIHPHYQKITVTCVCGNTFETGSTKSAIAVDICSKCHPFFTNEMRFVDRQGRVDKFRQKQAAAQARVASGKKPKTASEKKAEAQSFKDILTSQKQTVQA